MLPSGPYVAIPKTATNPTKKSALNLLLKIIHKKECPALRLESVASFKDLIELPDA